MKLHLLKLCLGLFILFIIFITYVRYLEDIRWRILNESLTLKRIFNRSKLDHTSLASPLIVTWTKFFSQPWAQHFEANVGGCAYHCIITDDKEQLLKASAVLFHIRDLKKLPKLRNPKQLFVFVLHESPLYTFNHLDFVPSNYFNITMTYRRDSDIYIPYGMMKKITNLTQRKQVWDWSEVVKIASSKVRPVLQLVSNCQTKSKRELYVEQLRTYINITQHGLCKNSICDEKCEVKEAAQHRFYLAFENSVCRDYITEKLFKCFLRLLIPVVLKRSIYEGILPPGSFIAADDFASPRELAEYLHYLSNNNTAYLSYLKWTRHYQKTFDVSNFCELCKYLHSDIARTRIIPDIKSGGFKGVLRTMLSTCSKKIKALVTSNC